MPKPKTSPDLSPKPYRLLKSDIAAKLSARSQGGISYVLLADTSDTPELHIAVTENVGGGGLWSKEAVSLTTTEAVLDTYGDQPFPTKALRGAMVGRSSNNPPFCLAVLKDLGLGMSGSTKTTPPGSRRPRGQGWIGMEGIGRKGRSAQRMLTFASMSRWVIT